MQGSVHMITDFSNSSQKKPILKLNSHHQDFDKLSIPIQESKLRGNSVRFEDVDEKDEEFLFVTESFREGN